MNDILKYLLRSHIVLALHSFIFLFGLYFEHKYSWIYALMISLGIIGIYNSHRLWKLKKGRLPTVIHDWTLLNKRTIYVLAIIPTLLAMFFYFWLFSGDLLQNVLTILCVVISVFYVKRIGKFALRDIPYLKVLFVLAIWYLLFFIFPYWLFDYDQPWMLNFLFLLIILIPSDIKDVYFDQKEMRTIPQVVGIQKSVNIIQLIVIISIIMLWFEWEIVRNGWAWMFGFLYFFILTLNYKKIGYKYFFVFADITFSLIGIVTIFLYFL